MYVTYVLLPLWRNKTIIIIIICSELSIGKQWSVDPGEEKNGYGGKHLQKRKVLSLEWNLEWAMDNESGESMEPMLQVPLIGLGESVLERLVRGWWREAGS